MAGEQANIALKTISQANYLFTFDIYKELASGTDNVFFSPISIQVILALVFLGAGGDTAKQIARGLRLPEDKKATVEGASAVMRQLQDCNDAVLNIANRIFTKNGFRIKEEFMNSAIRLKAGADELDFSEEEQARQIINGWVENYTHRKIRNIISPGALSVLTRMVLVNAIYFKGDWWKKFNKDWTSAEPFHLAPGSRRNVEMMYTEESFKYSDLSVLESQVLLLPYKGERFSMMIVLPRDKYGLSNVEKKLDSTNIQDILSEMVQRPVRVFLPKFKMEFKTDLTETLQTLGMTDMCDDARANLTGISDAPLAVSAVLHKAVVEVNEEGTEAAAASAQIIMAYAALTPDLPVTFKADHPFVFLILDQQTQTVLFAGRYSNPP